MMECSLCKKDVGDNYRKIMIEDKYWIRNQYQFMLCEPCILFHVDKLNKNEIQKVLVPCDVCHSSIQFKDLLSHKNADGTYKLLYCRACDKDGLVN